MAGSAAASSDIKLDLGDVDHRVGQLVGGGQLWEPCATSDIRRWVMAMDYPNPIHWDQEFARDSEFGGPAFEGDVTYFDAEVIETQSESSWGVPLAVVKVKLKNQDGGTLVDAVAHVELPVG